MSGTEYDPEVEELLLEQIRLDTSRRDTATDLLGSGTISWRTLANEDAPRVWAELRAWVEWFTVRYNVPVSSVPPCWWQHDALVEELSALHTAHLAAFDAADTGYGPLSWHERYAIAKPRLTQAYGGGCSTEHRPTKPRTWNNTTDETAWTAWTTQAHAHPSTHPGAPHQKKEEPS